MVQLAQLIWVCNAWRKVGKPVATMVPSSEDMNSAMDTMAKISHGERAPSSAVPVASEPAVGTLTPSATSSRQ